MYSLKIGHGDNVEGMEISVRNCISDINALFQESKRSRECYFSENVKCGIRKPFVELYGSAIMGSLVQSLLEEIDRAINNRFRFDDMGHCISGR